MSKKVKYLYILWLLCAAYATGNFIYVIFIRGELYNTTTDFLSISFLAALGVGVLSFLLASLRYSIESQSAERNGILKFLLGIISVLLFPLFLLSRIFLSFKGKKPKLLDVRYVGIIGVVILGIIWAGGYFVGYMGATRILGLRYVIAYMNEFDSMSPSFPANSIHKSYPYKNIVYKLNRQYAYKFQRGDIVAFSNQNIIDAEAALGHSTYAFAKRVIGISGDNIEIKAGMVFINGTAQVEPYTLEEYSTFIDPQRLTQWDKYFHNDMSECKSYTVPQAQLFVLGDNRKNSDDSRYIGFIREEDVTEYLPIQEQHEPYYEGNNLLKHDESWKNDRILPPDIHAKADQYCNQYLK